MLFRNSLITEFYCISGLWLKKEEPLIAERQERVWNSVVQTGVVCGIKLRL